MTRLWLAAAVASALSVAAVGAPVPPLHDPVAAAQGLVTRLLGAPYLSGFSFVVIPADPATGHEAYELDYAGGQVVVRGNTGVAMASGLHWYLKYTCNASIGWGRGGTGNQVATVPPPSKLPRPLPTRMVKPVRWVYAWNVCTFGYSFVWYAFEQWQAMVDWLAMNGVNAPLAFNGQEYVWQQFYLSLGLTEADLDPFFSGPSFLPWQRMGNLQGWGGPLDDAWKTDQRDLQLQLLPAMRAYGGCGAGGGGGGRARWQGHDRRPATRPVLARAQA
jgi:alpha-N-acetylglucosaminidase